MLALIISSKPPTEEDIIKDRKFNKWKKILLLKEITSNERNGCHEMTIIIDRKNYSKIEARHQRLS